MTALLTDVLAHPGAMLGGLSVALSFAAAAYARWLFGRVEAVAERVFERKTTAPAADKVVVP